MNTPPEPGRFRIWLRRLLWGLGGLLVLALLLDRVIMPMYTRQGDVSLLPRGAAGWCDAPGSDGARQGADQVV